MSLLSRKPSPVTCLCYFSCQVLGVKTTKQWRAVGLRYNRDVIQHRTRRFSCDVGSEAKCSMVRSCTENWTWTGTDLACTIGNCYCFVITAYSTFQTFFYDKFWLVFLVFAIAKFWPYNSLPDWLNRLSYTRLCKYRRILFAAFKPVK